MQKTAHFCIYWLCSAALCVHNFVLNSSDKDCNKNSLAYLCSCSHCIAHNKETVCAFDYMSVSMAICHHDVRLHSRMRSHDLLHLTDHSCSNYFMCGKCFSNFGAYTILWCESYCRSFSCACSPSRRNWRPSSVFGRNSFIYVLFNYIIMSNNELILLFRSDVEFYFYC